MNRGPEAPRGARQRPQKTLNYETQQQSRWFLRGIELNLLPSAALTHDVIVRGVKTSLAMLRAVRTADAQCRHFRRLAARAPASTATAAQPAATAEDGAEHPGKCKLAAATVRPPWARNSRNAWPMASSQGAVRLPRVARSRLRYHNPRPRLTTSI